MKIIISSDHGGFELKNIVIKYLLDKGYEVEDFGPKEYRGDDDYPEYVAPVVEKISSNKELLGILICRNGVGVSMLANKYEGIRATLSFNAEHAASARKDDNANVLTLPANYISQEDALKTVDSFLNTPFSEQERHKRRLDEVSSIEESNFK